MFLARYYRYSLGLGAGALLRGQVAPGLKRLLNPVSFWRCIEIPWVVDVLKPSPRDRLLDLGSPKLLSLYLADRIGCTVFAVDILADFIHEYHVLAEIRDGNLWGQGYRAMRQDGRCLSYRDRTFDKAYAISVVEHIPEDGDTLALRELARVLKPGGLVAVTVPFASSHTEDWVDRDVYERQREGGEPVFYQRRYDAHTLRHRLVKASGLVPVDQAFFTGFDVWDGFLMHVPLPVRAVLAPFQPLVVRPLVKRIQPEAASPSQYNLACLLLRKPE